MYCRAARGLTSWLIALPYLHTTSHCSAANSQLAAGQAARDTSRLKEWTGSCSGAACDEATFQVLSERVLLISGVLLLDARLAKKHKPRLDRMPQLPCIRLPLQIPTVAALSDAPPDTAAAVAASGANSSSDFQQGHTHTHTQSLTLILPVGWLLPTGDAVLQAESLL